MKTIILLSVLLLACTSTTVTVTEVQLDGFYDDCFDYQNHPYNQYNSYDDDYRRRQLYDEEDNYWEYDCDADCEAELDEYIQNVKDINDDEPVRPCDEWWEYELSVNYDANDIDVNLLFKYRECLFQLSYMNFEHDQYSILECTAMTLDEFLWENEIFEEQQFLILESADIIACENQCIDDVECDASCEDFIDTNFDETLGFCVDVELQRQEQADSGIHEDNGDRTEENGWMYRECIYENTWSVEAFYKGSETIDWDELYESIDYDTYKIDYSIFSNLDTDEQAALTLDCQAQCYDYYYLYGDAGYEYEFYDNDHVIIELYGEDFYDDYYDSYYEDFGDEDVYWEDEDFYYDLDCNEDDCFDENGQFIGKDGGKDNDCDTEYCFIEFYECIDKCTSKNCPKDTCYDKAKGQSLGNYISNICIGFNKLKEQYEQDDIIQNTAIVPPKYYESYGDCIAKLQIAEDNNEERELSDKEYITEYYTCLTACTEEEVVKQENEGKDGEGQTRLMLTLLSLIMSSLLLI